jgi:hypothetical protein
MVYPREGAVEVVLDNAGVYLVPVTPKAVELWTESAKKLGLGPSWEDRIPSVKLTREV